MPVRPLLLSMALPIVLSMLVQAVYNIVDSIFVARISEEAFTALSLVFPFQNVMIAVGFGTGVGINSLLSRSLGEKDYRKVKQIAQNGIFLCAVTYVVFLVTTLLFTRVYMESQTKNPVIVEHGITYMRIVGIYSFGIFAQLIFEKLLQSTGKTSYIVMTQGLGAVINIILDPIMIFGLFGFPKLGVAGAAIATVLGQIVGGIVAIILNFTKNKELSLDFKGFRPNLQVIANIYKIGVPSIIMASIGSGMLYLLNKILLVYSESAAAVLGAYFKIQSFVFMPVFGFTNAMIPIAAYNYGAQNKERLITAYRSCLLYALSIMLTGTLLFQLFASQILSFFNLMPETMEMGIQALRVISFCFMTAGFNIVSSSLFQALGNGVQSMLMSIIRQIVVIVPAAYILVKLFGIMQVWWAFLIGEAVVSVLCILFVRWNFKQKVHPLPDVPPVFAALE